VCLPAGLPNAGKSSVLNALLGRSAVGVSRAPGRTRYFQTHYLAGSVRLCDCPGLVFPSRAPPELQVRAHLARCHPGPGRAVPHSQSHFYPIFSPPTGPGRAVPHSQSSWAEKRGYRTARAARSDVARAANGLLRLAAEGRLRLCMTPPGFS
ncbi:GNL1 protein, partial [Rhabdornis inornatus]|nr:GNL1 protein [Rhabdornis inornatus]